MKTLYIILVVLLLVSGVIGQTSQPCATCLPEGITFTTQAQIDSFQVNYPNCTEIEGDVTIYGNDIANLNGLSILTSIGGIFEIGILDIGGNPSLTSLTGLDNLTSVGSGLIITNNDALTNLTGLDNLTSIGDTIIIYENDALTSLMGLDNLTSIGGFLSIGDNDALTSLTGLDNLTSIGRYLIIGSNDALTSLTGLDNLTSIGSSLNIYYNDALTSLTGLDNLTSIGSDLNIEYNDALTSLTGLDNLTSIVYSIELVYNPNLTSLTGLDNLNFIGGVLKIDRNDALTSLTGLDNLTSIGSYLYIGYNNALTSLTGLDNLTSIGGNLDIEYNPALTSLTGLDNISGGSISYLNISENVLLSTCAIQSICDYLAAPNGDVDISDNATGCNSQEEVVAACKEGIDENGTPDPHITIYPTPASTIITISLPSITPVGNTTLSIFNVNAQQVISNRITESQTVVDISTLPRGVYFARITTDATVLVTKFIKQ